MNDWKGNILSRIEESSSRIGEIDGALTRQ
jgi:hypothetical protein